MIISMRITVQNEAETANAAQNFADKLKNSDLCAFYGDLGAGKTHFCRAVIQHLCGNHVTVPSPTFTLVETYDSPHGPIWHFDAYRLDHPDEIFEIGWEEARQDGIILLEWPEKIGSILPKAVWTVTLENDSSDPNMRHITITEPERPS